VPSFCPVKGRPSLLFVGGEREGRYFLDLARKNGISAEILPPSRFPDDVSKLADKDVIVIGNLPSSAFREAQMEAMWLFVNQIGGGVLMLGGDRAFGAGGYFNTPVERFSPVNMDPRGKEQRMALVALVDKSGSMAIWRWLILVSVILVMLELIMRKVRIRSFSTFPSRPSDISEKEIREKDKYIERLLRLKPQA